MINLKPCTMSVAMRDAGGGLTSVKNKVTIDFRCNQSVIIILYKQQRRMK